MYQRAFSLCYTGCFAAKSKGTFVTYNGQEKRMHEKINSSKVVEKELCSR